MEVDYAYYTSLYGTEEMPVGTFARLSWDACKKVHNATTGADGVDKLALYPPQDRDAVEAVKRCVCELIHIASDLEKANADAKKAREYIADGAGNLRGRVVSSVSAGNESVSYATSSSASVATLTDKALTDLPTRTKMERETMRVYLSGVCDNNGVPLLYAGEYPRCANVQ